MEAAAKKRLLKVAIYQYRPREESPQSRVSRLERMLATHAAQPPDLVVCPELFLSGYKAAERFDALSESSSGHFAREMAALARRRSTAICYGYPEAVEDARYNSAAVIGKDGELLANHRKLFFPTTVCFEEHYFSTGNALTVFELEGFKVGVLICYEVEFPELVRALALKGCEVVIVPTALNAKWDFVASKMIPTRAFESGLFVMYANYAGTESDTTYLGRSVIVAPDGMELARADDSECWIMASIEPGHVEVEQARHSYLSNQVAVREVTR